MKFTYLVGEGPEYKFLYGEVMAEYKESQKPLRVFEESLTDGLRAFCNTRDGKVIAVGSHDELPSERRKSLGLNAPHNIVDDYYLYRPAKNTKTGKELSKVIEEVNKSQFAPKKVFIERLGVDCMNFQGRKVYISTVGYDESKIYVRIPAVEGDKEYPTAIVPWLREPQGEEFKVFL